MACKKPKRPVEVEEEDDLLFSQQEMDRYSRTVALKEVGYEGQAKLKKAKVLVVGAGGLGSPALLWMAAAGVGTLGICDMDEVDLSNLQRQVLHTTEAAMRKIHKVDSAVVTLQHLNPDVTYNKYKAEMTLALAKKLIPQYDIVVDCLDNHETRYLLSDQCVKQRKPLVTAAVDRYLGLVRVLCTKKSPCMRCIDPTIPPPGDEPRCVGLFGTGTGVLGVMQAAEVIKMILGLGSSLEGRTLYYNGLEAAMYTVPMLKNPKCKWCKK